MNMFLYPSSKTSCMKPLKHTALQQLHPKVKCTQGYYSMVHDCFTSQSKAVKRGQPGFCPVRGHVFAKLEISGLRFDAFFRNLSCILSFQFFCQINVLAWGLHSTRCEFFLRAPWWAPLSPSQQLFPLSLLISFYLQTVNSCIYYHPNRLKQGLQRYHSNQ